MPLGIVTAVFMAMVMKLSIFKGEPVPFVMELPNYRMPSSKSVCQLLWDKAKDFLQRAFTVIFVATIIIWFLQTFDIKFNIVTNSQESILATIAGFIAPIFKPLGFGDWRISTALITGFMAKESVVSTLLCFIWFGRICYKLNFTAWCSFTFGILPFIHTLRCRNCVR